MCIWRRKKNIFLLVWQKLLFQPANDTTGRFLFVRGITRIVCTVGMRRHCTGSTECNASSLECGICKCCPCRKYIMTRIFTKYPSIVLSCSRSVHAYYVIFVSLFHPITPKEEKLTKQEEVDGFFFLCLCSLANEAKEQIFMHKYKKAITHTLISNQTL